MDESFIDLFRSACFWSAFWAWVAAQSTKMLCSFVKTRRFDFSYMVSTGGMPSAHSALAAGLATAIGLQTGFDSPVFALALGFALITMFDASTVRHAAGQQARLLNEIVDELFTAHRLSERKLKELLGHTRLEVFLGAVIGILAALLVYAVAIHLTPA